LFVVGLIFLPICPRTRYNQKLGVPEGYSYYVALAVGVPATTKEPHAYDFERDVTIL